VAVSFDAVTSGSFPSKTTGTVSHTCSGSNRALYAVIDMRASDIVTGCTYNGVALTKLGVIDTITMNAQIWRMIAPPTGAHDLTVTTSANRRFILHAVSFTGVHQTTPDGTPVTGSGTGAGGIHPSVVVSSAAGEVVLDGAALRNDDNTSTLTADAGQTDRGNLANSNGTNSGIRGACSTEPGAASTTMSWTADGTDAWAQIAVAIKPTATLDQAINDILAVTDQMTPNNVAPGGSRAGNILMTGVA